MGTGQGGYTRLEFSIPVTRTDRIPPGDFMTDTKGNGIMNAVFDGYGRTRETCSTAARVP